MNENRWHLLGDHASVLAKDQEKYVDKVINYFVISFYIFGLIISPYYDTWIWSLGIGSLNLGLFLVAIKLVKSKFIKRLIISLIFSIFMLQFISQMHGMYEMHFFFFTNIAILILYQDWRVLWPYTIFAISHHSFFFYLQLNGVDNLGKYFINDVQVTTTVLLFHFGLAIFMTIISSWWANLLKNHKEALLVLVDKANEQNEELSWQEQELQSLLYKETKSKRNLELTLKELTNTQSKLVHSEKMSSLGKLTAGIAHEINNPVNFISGSLEPLKRDLKLINDCFELFKSGKFESIEMLNDYFIQNDLGYNLIEIEQLIESIELGAGRTTEIVKGLRSFSKADTKNAESINLKESIDSALLIMKGKLKNTVEIETNIDDELVIECYPGQLNQVFVNLISNAYDAIEEKGEIKINASKIDDEFCKIEFLDTGTGIKEEVINKIFDPFYSTKVVGKGTGLGLSISNTIILAHGGTINVENVIPHGANFTIKLPLQMNKDVSKDGKPKAENIIS